MSRHSQSMGTWNLKFQLFDLLEIVEVGRQPIRRCRKFERGRNFELGIHPVVADARRDAVCISWWSDAVCVS
jgi:hypothetical protein